MKLETFVHGRRWREPLCGGYVYCRHSVRTTSRGQLRCIDLADTDIPEPQRGQGALTAFLEQVEAQVSPAGAFQAIYIENVFNRRLVGFFTRRRGYVSVAATAGPPSFFYLPCERSADEPLPPEVLVDAHTDCVHQSEPLRPGRRQHQGI